MGMVTRTGSATGLVRSSQTEGAVGRNGGSVRTAQVLTFRLDGKVVEIKLPTQPNVDDGESVTVAGREKNGVFRALALRNDVTGAVYAIPSGPGFVMGGLLVVLGVPLLFVVVGVLFLGFGGWTVYQAWTYRQAAQLLAR
jgi:hypothetical protein